MVADNGEPLHQIAYQHLQKALTEYFIHVGDLPLCQPPTGTYNWTPENMEKQSTLEACTLALEEDDMFLDDMDVDYSRYEEGNDDVDSTD